LKKRLADQSAPAPSLPGQFSKDDMLLQYISYNICLSAKKSEVTNLPAFQTSLVNLY